MSEVGPLHLDGALVLPGNAVWGVASPQPPA